MSIGMFLDNIGQHQRQLAAQDSIGGNSPTWPVQTADVPLAIWPKGSTLANTFARRDMLGTHVLATNVNIAAKVKDRISVGSVYYVVDGYEPFVNAGASGETLYLIDCTLRTV